MKPEPSDPVHMQVLRRMGAREEEINQYQKKVEEMMALNEVKDVSILLPSQQGGMPLVRLGVFGSRDVTLPSVGEPVPEARETR